jgi:predicted PurR-regulated permease PerM
MSEPTQRAGSGGRGFLLTLASLVVVIAGLKAAAVFFLPLLLALFLTILAFPLFTSLRRHRAPAWLAIAVTMLVMAALVGMVGLVITISVEDLTEKLPEYSDEARAATLRTIDWLEDHRVTVPRQITTDALDPLEWGAIAQFVGSTFRGVATALSAFLLVLLTMVFMLWEAVIFPGKLRAAARSGPIDLERWTAIVQRVQRYLILKTLVSLATGALVTLLVWAVGLDFALFWGFLAFVLNYIPNVGSFLAALPAVLLSSIQLGGPRTVILAAGYLVINVVLGNLVEPAIMGRGLRMSPFAIFLALVFWGWLWGPLGMILSVPLTVSLKILLENTENLRWIALLLDRRPRDPAK